MNKKRPPTVDVLPPARAVLDEVVSWSRFSQKDAANAVLEWFGTLDRDTQGAILGALPMSRRPDFARLILQKMADEVVPKYPVGAAVFSKSEVNDSPGASNAQANASTTNGPANATATSRAAEGRRVKGLK